MKKNTLRHSLLLLLTAAIWGFAFVAQSVGMDYVQPFTFTAARSLIGGIVLLPFIFIRAQKAGRTSEEKSASWKQALPGGIICGVLLCIASNLQQIGIQYTTVGKSGFITAMYIVLVPVLGILFHKKTGIRVWISVALAVCGLYLLCMTGGSFRLQRGDLYTLCCALIFSLQILAVDHYAPIADNAILACIEFFTCGICSLIPMFLLEQPRMHLILAAWLPILYAGILSNGLHSAVFCTAGTSCLYSLSANEHGIRVLASGRFSHPTPDAERPRAYRMCTDVCRHYSCTNKRKRKGVD